MNIIRVGDLLPDGSLSRYYVFPTKDGGVMCFDSNKKTIREISFGELSDVLNNPQLLVRTLEETLGLNGLELELVFTGFGNFSPSYK